MTLAQGVPAATLSLMRPPVSRQPQHVVVLERPRPSRLALFSLPAYNPVAMYEDEIEAQVERLIQLLDEIVHQTRRSRRSLERQLGLAHGYIGNLLRGRTELKVSHVLLLSKLLDLDPVDLLRRALEGEGRPPAGAAPASARGAAAAVAAAESAEAEERAPGMDLDRLQELIRQTFRDEVRKLGGNLAKMGAEP
ncbi:MAG: hypothetical protein QOJ16_1571 [Acidobacteriota bacterium]|jgi:transcriptional regulator with XRE-family HTH domain|nr:hypothetical protein [Acidobacteriota bacterium]